MGHVVVLLAEEDTMTVYYVSVVRQTKAYPNMIMHFEI